MQRKKFNIIIIAMGCPGRVLQKRILEKGFEAYLFDFVSLLDTFNDETSRSWINFVGGPSRFKNLLNRIE